MSQNINRSPYFVQLTVAAGSTYNGANLTTFTVPAYELAVLNLSASQAVQCRVNGLSSNGTLTIPANTQVILPNAVYSSVDFANSNSGAVNASVEIAAAVSPN